MRLAVMGDNVAQALMRKHGEFLSDTMSSDGAEQRRY